MKYLKKFNEQSELPEGMQIGGLKCDNPNCEYSDMSVPFSDYESSIGKPCPNCGESLLTQEDYDQVIQIINAFDAVSSFSEEELQQLANNMSQEEIDGALDMMNKLKIKKKGQDDQGNDIWSIGESLSYDEEREMNKIYRDWLDNGTIMTDYGLMEYIYSKYTLIPKK